MSAATVDDVPAAVGELRHVPPSELLLERNIRETRLDDPFVKSIAELGVLEPITAVVNDTGGLVVRFGHRRTLGAVKAGRPTVPVYVVANDDTADAAEVDRIVRQHDENIRREGLTAGEQIGVVEQLAAFGISAAQITKRLRVPRTTVDAAITATGSDVARQAAQDYELTVDQAAALAEFDDDPEVTEALIETAKSQPHQFDHQVQRKRDDRVEAEKIQAVRNTLMAEQCRIVEHPNFTSKTKALSELVEDTSGDDITVESHRTCRGHVAWVDLRYGDVNPDGTPVTLEQESAHEEWAAACDAIAERDDAPEDEAEFQTWYEKQVEALGPDPLAGVKYGRIYRPVYGCSDPANLGHRGRWGTSTTKTPVAEMSDHEREKATKDRRLVVENNKAWDSAETVRRAAVKTYAAAKKLPPGGEAFIALATTTNQRALAEVDASGLAGEWLGIAKSKGWPYRADLAGAAEKATPARALVIVLVHCLAAYEHQLTRDAWRRDGTKSEAGQYLRFLEQAYGYPLSDVEKYAISKKTV